LGCGWQPNTGKGELGDETREAVLSLAPRSERERDSEGARERERERQRGREREAGDVLARGRRSPKPRNA